MMVKGREWGVMLIGQVVAAGESCHGGRQRERERVMRSRRVGVGASFSKQACIYDQLPTTCNSLPSVLLACS